MKGQLAQRASILLTNERPYDRRRTMERRKHPRFSISQPLEWWRLYGCRLHGGFSGNLSEGGLHIYSVSNLRVGEELMLRVYFANGYKLDCFEVRANVIWKDAYCGPEWRGFQYGFNFSQILREDQWKLRQLLPAPGSSKEVHEGTRPRGGSTPHAQRVPDLQL